MDTKNDKASHLSEADQKKLAGLTIGVGIGTVVATGATVGAVVTGNDDNKLDDSTSAEVSDGHDEVSEDDLPVDDTLIVSEEDIEAGGVEMDDAVLEDSVEVLDMDTTSNMEPDDLYLDDISSSDDLLDDSIGDSIMM